MGNNNVLKKGNVLLIPFLFLLVLVITTVLINYKEFTMNKILNLLRNIASYYKINVNTGSSEIITTSLDGTLCIITDSKSTVDNIVKSLNLSYSLIKVYSPYSVSCDLEGCDYIYIDKYIDNKNMECILKNYRVVVNYEGVHNTDGEKVLVASSGGKVYVSGDVTSSMNCVYPYCYFKEYYNDYVYNVVCLNTPTQTVKDYPFTCYDSQHLLLLFDNNKIISNYPSYFIALLETK